MRDLQDRYQFKSWYVKLWRLRWYILIPYWTFRAWINSNNHEFDFKTLWGISTGMAQSHMGWYYTVEEVKTRFEKRRDNAENK